MPTAEELAAALRAPIEARSGAPVRSVRCTPITAGASADTWSVDAEREDGSVERLVFRRDAGGDDFGGRIGKSSEARTQAAAHRAGVRVAEVLHVVEGDPALGDGYLMRRLGGESLAPRILKKPELEAARAALVPDLATALGRIHAIPTSEVSFLPELGAAKQLEDLHALHSGFGDPLPVFALAHRYLATHLPEAPETTLVHGDFRLGNFLVDEHGLVGVLDWELAHRGDPHEDLGWLSVNAWRFGGKLPVGGFARREDFFEAYERASGRRVDPGRVLFWELFGTYKWGVICQYQAFTYLNGGVSSIERVAIGRRVAETEVDMLSILEELCR